MIPTPVSTADIADLVARAVTINDAFMDGRMDDRLRIANPSADFSIMTPFGGWSAGGFDASPERLAAMARRFPSATTALDLISTHASGDMVVLAAIERQVAVVGNLPAQDWSLRVTLVVRHHGSDRELVHRRADPLVRDITLPRAAAVARGEVGSGDAVGDPAGCTAVQSARRHHRHADLSE